MPRSSGWPFAFLVLIALGCAPEQPAIYVDLGNVGPESMLSGPSSLPLPPSGTEIVTRADTEAVPARDLFVPVSRQRVQAALAAIEADRKRAFDSLLDELRSQNEADVAARRRELSDLAETEYAAQVAAVLEALKPTFEQYARQRAMPAVRLSLLVGFPDRDPQSKKLREPQSKREEQLQQRIRTLRDELMRIDEEYAAKVKLELARVVAGKGDLERRHLDEIEALRRDLEAKALKIAGDTLASRGSSVNLQLTESLDERLPAVEASAAEQRMAASVPHPPTVPSRPVTPTSRKDLEAELQIWMDLNGYKRAGSPTNGLDKTDEFLKWRRTYRDGH